MSDNNISKVVYDGETLIDLTEDTVTAGALQSGSTAHDASGNRIIGTMVTTKDYQDLENKPSINGVEVSGDKSAEDYKLKCTVHVTTKDFKTYTSDKTFSEIKELLDADCEVVVSDDTAGGLYKLLSASNSYIKFENSSGLIQNIFTFNAFNENVSYEMTDILIPAGDSYIGGVFANQATEEDTLPVNIDENGFLKVAAKPKDFVVTFTIDYSNDPTTVTSDKTFDEIKEAYDSGAIILGLSGSDIYELKDITDDIYQSLSFDFSGSSSFSIPKVRYYNGTWSLDLIEYKAGSIDIGGICADNRDPNIDKVSAKIGTDNKLYVPEYPTLESLGAQPKDFVVNFTSNDNTNPATVEADKTFDEIKNAYDAGRTIIGIGEGNSGYFYLDNITVYESGYSQMSFQLRTNELSHGAYFYDNGKWEYIYSSILPGEYTYGGIKASSKTDNDTIPINFDSDSGFAYAALNIGDKIEYDTSYTSEVKKDPTTNKLYVSDSSPLQLKLTPVFDEVQEEEQTRSVSNELGISKLINSNDIPFEELENALKSGRPINAYIDFGEDGYNITDYNSTIYILNLIPGDLLSSPDDPLKGITFISQTYFLNVVLTSDGTILVY